MKIYNTLTGQKEEFVPQGDVVKMYVCGVTPYDNSHLGHAMSYIFFDVIRRYLKFSGYKIKYIQNVTDIDDKIIMRANQRGISTAELSGKFSDSYFEDMQALNVMPADANPRATEEVPAIIEVIRGLVDKGYAYRTPDGSVYFRVTRCRITASCLTAHWTGCRPERASRWVRKKNIRWTSLSGKPPSPANRPGIVPGAKVGPAGISNAPRCPLNIWAKPWIFTAAAKTLFSLIMRMRLLNLRAIPIKSHLPGTGCTMDWSRWVKRR